MPSRDAAHATSAYTPVVDRHLAPEVRMARLTADIAARLQSVCAAMPPAAFDVLVEDIARLKLHWAETE